MEPTDFSSSDFDALDEGRMTVHMNGRPTTWKWIFAGPGHDKTIAQTERLSREKLAEARQIEQQRLNGRKVKVPEDRVEDVRARNIDWIVERLIDWTPVRIDGKDFPFSPENARKMLSDPRKADLLTQAVEFLTGEQSFLQGSAQT